MLHPPTTMMKSERRESFSASDRLRFRRRSSNNSSGKPLRRNQKSNSTSSTTSSGNRYFDASSLLDNELAAIEIDYSVNEDDEFKLTAPTDPHGKQFVYSVDFLIQLRESPLVEPFKGLPDNDFWRKYLHSKKRNEGYSSSPFHNNTSLSSGSNNHSHANINPHGSSSGNQSYIGHGNGNGSNGNNNDNHESTGEMGSFAIKPTKADRFGVPSSKNNSKFTFKKSNRASNRDHGRHHGSYGDFEDEEPPAWLIDDNDDDQSVIKATGLDVIPKTVEDFEKWKLRMKLQEKRKQGKITAEEEKQLDALINNREPLLPTSNKFANSANSGLGNNATNGGGVDSPFFAFTPYDLEKNDLLNTSLEDSVSSENHNGNNHNDHEDSSVSGSSRFSSFFGPRGAATPLSISSADKGAQPVLSQGGANTGNPATSNIVDRAAGSRILSILGKNSPQDSPVQQQSPTIPSAPQEKKKESSNDMFFMSLLNKKVGSNEQQALPSALPATPANRQSGQSNLMALFSKANQEQLQKQLLSPQAIPQQILQQQQQQQQQRQQQPAQQDQNIPYKQSPYAIHMGQQIPPPHLLNGQNQSPLVQGHNLQQRQGQQPGQLPQPQQQPHGLPPQGFPPGFPPINHIQQFPPGQYPSPQQQQNIPPQFRGSQPLPPWLAQPKLSNEVISTKEGGKNGNNAHEANSPFMVNVNSNQQGGPIPPPPPGFRMVHPMYGPVPPNMMGNMPPIPPDMLPPQSMPPQSFAPHLQQNGLPPNLPPHMYGGPPRQ